MSMVGRQGGIKGSREELTKSFWEFYSENRNGENPAWD